MNVQGPAGVSGSEADRIVPGKKEKVKNKYSENVRLRNIRGCE